MAALVLTSDYVYVMYDAPDHYKTNENDPPTDGVLVQGQDGKKLTGFAFLRLTNREDYSFSCSKVCRYSGKEYSVQHGSQTVTTDDFPVGNSGVSSFIVLKGTWNLQDAENIVFSIPLVQVINVPILVRRLMIM